MSNKELTLEEARKLKRLDKNNLDTMLLEQASLFEEIGYSSIMCTNKRDLAKENLDNMDARISDEFKNKATIKGEKITEAALSRKVLQDERHKESFKIYTELKLEAALWENLKKSFSAGQRPSMLKELCELYNNQYYDRESIKGNTSTAKIKDQSRQDMIKEKNERSPRKRVTR